MNGVLAVPLTGQLAICVRLYLLHRELAGGLCRCGAAAAECTARRNAARVMMASRLDPVSLDKDLNIRRAALLWLCSPDRRHRPKPWTDGSVVERGTRAGCLVRVDLTDRLAGTRTWPVNQRRPRSCPE